MRLLWRRRGGARNWRNRERYGPKLKVPAGERRVPPLNSGLQHYTVHRDVIGRMCNGQFGGDMMGSDVGEDLYLQQSAGSAFSWWAMMTPAEKDAFIARVREESFQERERRSGRKA